MSETTVAPASARSWLSRWWVEALILSLSLLFRLAWLEVKPPHFDEGVNGFFVDQMRDQGFYHYDPTNFHGPLHFYLLFIAQTLLGREIWALRLVTVLAGVAAVALTLAFRRYFSPVTCRLAAAAMALSPAFIFYARYAIHESELLCFLLLVVWGLLGLMQKGDFRSLAAVILGAAGCILTKETYLIHFVAFALAFPTLAAWERLRQRRSPLLAPARWTPRQAWILSGLAAALIVFFYSGALMDFPGLAGLVTTFQTWISTGTAEGGGQNKKWHYWLQLLSRYEPRYTFHPMEWPALLGLAAGVWLVFGTRNRALRYLLIAGFGTFVAYCLIPYKTPWCLLAFIWPFYFAFGEAFAALARGYHRSVAYSLAALALGASAWSATRLNFRDFTEETEPYVYVQTLPAIERALEPIRWWGEQGPEGRLFRGYILYPSGDSHPLPWLLGDYPNIAFLGEKDAQPVMDADFLLVEDSYVADMEDRLTESYFREPIVIRGNSGESGFLYLRASVFAPHFPGRVPEFTPFPAEPPATPPLAP